MRQQIQELGEDAEFYRQERDYLATVLYDGPDRDRHFPRPPSPRQYRTAHNSSEMEMEYTPATSESNDQPGLDDHGGHRDDRKYSSERHTSENSAESSVAGSSQGYGRPAYTQLTQPVYQQQAAPSQPSHHLSLPPLPAQPPASSSRSSRSYHHTSDRHAKESSHRRR